MLFPSSRLPIPLGRQLKAQGAESGPDLFADCKVWRRRAWALAFLLLFTLLGGCVNLPANVERSASWAVPASTATFLGRVAANSSPDPALSGLRLLPSGAFALDARLQLARRSERTLDLQYFLVEHDTSGRQVLRELRDAAKRGVRVRLLLDDLNTVGQDDLLLGLAAHSNVEVRLFNPFPAGRGSLFARFASSLLSFETLNHRMHNKLFVADGAMAITGGRNIADAYFARHALSNFLDLDIFVTGAVVEELSTIFDRYWNNPFAYPLESIAFDTRSRVERQEYFEKMSLATPLPASVPLRDVLGHEPIVDEMDGGRLALTWGVAEAYADPPGPPPRSSSPDPAQDRSRVRFNVLDHIRESKSEVVLVTPYLIPGRTGMDLIHEVRRRGVKVNMLTNSLASTDQPLAHIGYRRYRSDLLKAGVDLYEISPLRVQSEPRRRLFGASVGGLHSKAVVFDRDELFIGSMNFDPRSDHYNSEMGLFIHSPAISREAWQLVELVELQAAHKLSLLDGGRLEWRDPADPDGNIHTDEPESSGWLRLLLDLLAPFAPEELL